MSVQRGEGGDGGGRRLGRALGLAAGASALLFAAGWVGTDRLERDNDFCNACHLRPGVPLHREVRRDFERAPAASLAAGHARAGLAAHGEGARDFRCIDCHGGVGPIGRLRVKALAAKDAFWYVVGHFEEPESMRWPLWDEDCAQCHARFDEREPEPFESPRFHQLAVHNAALGVACVACHASHRPGGDPAAHFIHAEPVRARCAGCHPEFESLE